jgi:hypothetical protein
VPLLAGEVPEVDEVELLRLGELEDLGREVAVLDAELDPDAVARDHLADEPGPDRAARLAVGAPFLEVLPAVAQRHAARG